jgi:hypothetical protein
MESKEIPYVSMESKEIPYVSMDCKEITYNLLNFYQLFTDEERMIPFIFDHFHFCEGVHYLNPFEV